MVQSGTRAHSEEISTLTVVISIKGSYNQTIDSDKWWWIDDSHFSLLLFSLYRFDLWSLERRNTVEKESAWLSSLSFVEVTSNLGVTEKNNWRLVCIGNKRQPEIRNVSRRREKRKGNEWNIGEIWVSLGNESEKPLRRMTRWKGGGTLIEQKNDLSSRLDIFRFEITFISDYWMWGKARRESSDEWTTRSKSLYQKWRTLRKSSEE